MDLLFKIDFLIACLVVAGAVFAWLALWLIWATTPDEWSSERDRLDALREME